MTKICYKWSDCNIQWSDANWTWAECQLVEDIISFRTDGVDPTNFFPKWIDEPTTALDKEKKKRFIKLICKVKGEEPYSEEKLARDDIKIDVNDIKLVVKKVANVDLIITNE